MNEAQKQIIEEAQRKYQAAAEDLVLAVMEMFPAGSVIECSVGRSRITGEVESAGGCWWHRPGGISIKNLKTGRQRRISATAKSHDIKIISTP